MVDGPVVDGVGVDLTDTTAVTTPSDLAALLRQLRRRQAHHRGEPPLTYRALAAKTGWSRATIGDYLSGKTLPPTDRFDVLVRLLGAAQAELGPLATARDCVDEHRRHSGPAGFGVPGSAAAPAVPRQLPKPVRHLAGRGVELAALDELLEESADTGMTVVAVISGTGGIGKTALAVFWAHRAVAHFPDGQLYVNLRGFGPSGNPVPAEQAVHRFLEALGLPPERMPVDLDAQAAAYRSLLTGRRVLIMLDNARDAEQVRPLLPATNGCATLITSRNRLTDLVVQEKARPLSLDVLTSAAARELLASRLGPVRVLTEPAAAEQLVTCCSGLPLALSMAAARVSGQIRPRLPLAALVDELTAAGGGLYPFECEDPTVSLRTALSWSYQALPAPAARLFRLLGLHPGPDFTAAAAASLAGLPIGAARDLLSVLDEAHLVAEQTTDRFACHALLRVYARELAETVEPVVARRAALQRLFDHYLAAAQAAAMLLHPHRQSVPVTPPGPDVTVEVFNCPDDALTWLEIEHPVLLNVVRQALAAGFDRHVWQLAWTLAGFHRQQGYWQEWLTTQQTALRAAQRLRDRDGLAHSHRSIGCAYVRFAQYAEAEAHLRQALRLFSKLGQPIAEGDTYLDLAWILALEGDHAGAAECAGSALGLHQSVGDQLDQAHALDNLGDFLLAGGEPNAACTTRQQAYLLLAELSHPYADWVRSKLHPL